MSVENASGYLQRAGRGAYALGRRLMRDGGPGYTHQAIVTALATAVDAQFGALALFAPDDGVLRIEATHGYPHAIVEHIRVRPGEGILGQVFASGRSLLVGADTPLVALPQRRRYRTQSCIVMPLNSRGAVLGVVAVSDPTDGKHFSRIDVRALKLYLPPVVLTLEAHRLGSRIAAVSRAAIVDPVTGLANRQYLGTRLDAEMQRARRVEQPLAVMLLDIDNFKMVNDTWGHLVGDRVLRDLAGLVSEHVRVFDVCTRYGGEEFAILMPGADQSVAFQVAERVRKAAEQAYGDAGSGVRITLSAGVTLLDAQDTAESVLDRADRALLRAKADGKNLVRVSERNSRTNVPL